MDPTKPRCLILACGNTLRSDDGVGPWLADWAEQHFAEDPRIRVISRQQWTPDLAEDIASADAVLFLDCSVESAPGEIQLRPVAPQPSTPGLATHHTNAAELLAVAQGLYGAIPKTSLLLTIGAGGTELGESFSPAITASLPEAQRRVHDAISSLLAYRPDATNLNE
jgi:hydrogenase maturation protease